VVKMLVLLVVTEAVMVSTVPLYISAFPVSFGIPDRLSHGRELGVNMI